MSDFEACLLAKESVKDESFTNNKQTDFLHRRACICAGELLRLWIKTASKPFFLHESINGVRGLISLGALKNPTRSLPASFGG